MRTWIKDGARMLMTGVALAGVSAVLAYSGVTTDQYTLPADRDERRQDTPAAEEPDATVTAGTSMLTRPRMAGAAGVALAVLGVSMLIRRRRRAAGPGEEI